MDAQFDAAGFYRSGQWTTLVGKLGLGVPPMLKNDPFRFWAEQPTTLDATDLALDAADWANLESMVRCGCFAKVTKLILIGSPALLEQSMVPRVAGFVTGGEMASLVQVVIERAWDAPPLRIREMSAADLTEVMHEKRDADDANELLQLRSNGIRAAMKVNSWE
jgi:hypothetical protein